MGRLKRALSEEALDALELVEEGRMTDEEWLKQYSPIWVDPVEKGGDLT